MSPLAQPRWGGVLCLIRTPAEVTDYRYSHLQPLPTTGLLRKRQHFTSAPPRQLRCRGRERFELQSSQFKSCIIKRVSHITRKGLTAARTSTRSQRWQRSRERHSDAPEKPGRRPNMALKLPRLTVPGAQFKRYPNQSMWCKTGVIPV